MNLSSSSADAGRPFPLTREGRPAIRPLVYAAHPIHTYQTPHEETHLRWLSESMHGWEILNPADLYQDNIDWLRLWPELIPTLSCVVVFADEQGYVGVGCLREIADAILARIPVLGLDLRVGLSETVSFDIVPPTMRTARRAAVLVLGACPHACQTREARSA